MKQIVPFKKELSFKTKVSEITSISLEREINVEEEGIITGVFHITGNYKMNEGSINRDEFSFSKLVFFSCKLLFSFSNFL